MRYVSLFSGIEAASVAWEGLGWEPVAYSEIDPFPCAVLAERFPEVPNLGDVKEIKWKRYRGQVDLAVGGSPCQSFSIAGKREGLDGASGLMWEYVRCVREVRPRWLLWENVPGALSSSRGEDFRCLLDSLGDLGYGLAWRVLDAQFFGVAQRRRRLFVVGRLGAEPPVQVLFEPGSLSGDFETGRKERARIAARSGGGAHGGGVVAMTSWDVQSKRIYSADGPSPSLPAGSGEGMNIQPIICVGDATSKAAVDEDIAGTLKVGGSPGYISAKTAVVRCGSPGGGKGALVSDDVSLTLATGNEQTLFAPEGKKYVVRRLTPTECERLQGFPDGWTKVPYRGKPAEECPDGPRYKALGNSMAVPVMRWIGRRIAMEEEQGADE